MSKDNKPSLMLPLMGPLYDGLHPFAIPTIRIIAGLCAVPHGYMKLFTDPGDQIMAEFSQKSITDRPCSWPIQWH